MAIVTGGPPGSPDRLPDALDHAWKWFSYHAQQRLTAFNFYLVIVGVLVVGYFKCLEQGWHPIGAFVAFFGAVISLAFWLLDIRNTELVNCGREALKDLEPEFKLKIREMDDGRTSLWDSIGRPSRFVFRLRRDEKGTPPSWMKVLTKHQLWLRVILGIGFVAFTVGFLTSLGAALGVGPDVSPRSRIASEYLLRRVDRMITLLNQVDSASKEKPATLGSARVMRDASLALILLSQEAATDCRLQRKVDPACTKLRAWSTKAMPVFQQLSVYDGSAPLAATNRTLAELTAGLDGIVDSLRGALSAG